MEVREKLEKVLSSSSRKTNDIDVVKEYLYQQYWKHMQKGAKVSPIDAEYPVTAKKNCMGMPTQNIYIKQVDEGIYQFKIGDFPTSVKYTIDKSQLPYFVKANEIQGGFYLRF